jgi:hypothetical protein
MRRVVDRLQAAAGLTDIAVASLRQLTTALRPPVLDHLGLVPAIRWETSLFSKRTGIRCHVRARPSSIDLDEARVTALYRILVGALENIARHAAAGTAWIYVTRQRGLTMMEVRDNGRGITDEQVNNPRTMGLLGMRERAIALGGDVRITGARGHGTRVLVTLPDANTAAALETRRDGRSRAHACARPTRRRSPDRPSRIAVCWRRVSHIRLSEAVDGVSALRAASYHALGADQPCPATAASWSSGACTASFRRSRCSSSRCTRPISSRSARCRPEQWGT